MQLRILSPQEVISLSTPHGALGTGGKRKKGKEKKKLSTPHGALGTRDVELEKKGVFAFNSTRCIRN